MLESMLVPWGGGGGSHWQERKMVSSLKEFLPLSAYPAWGDRVGKFPYTWPLGQAY